MVFDIIFLLIFVWAAFKGYMKGFILQAASLAALILGIWGAIKFSGYVAAIILEKMGGQGEYIPLISFGITFLLIVIIIHLLAKLTEKLLEMIALSFANRIVGVIFSIIKYAFIISVFLSVLNNFNRKLNFLPQDKISESRLYKPLSAIAPKVFPYLYFDFTHPLDTPKDDPVEDTIALFH